MSGVMGGRRSVAEFAFFEPLAVHTLLVPWEPIGPWRPVAEPFEFAVAKLSPERIRKPEQGGVMDSTILEFWVALHTGLWA